MFWYNVYLLHFLYPSLSPGSLTIYPSLCPGSLCPGSLPLGLFPLGLLPSTNVHQPFSAFNFPPLRHTVPLPAINALPISFVILANVNKIL